ncbi:hypothetical protein [Bradyrhizobium sp. Ai1a-2]|uniref:hypothetical protein n=1 Tax=Bradyrhizobium sp. Ai1a-2 TaxID=196490 RepID=UPI00040690F6|nr:hypothetical protein [Bradyrhizobium sp. Ai1a-2]
MSNRARRRRDVARFRHDAAGGALLTYLVPPGDVRLNAAPLLRTAADNWLDALTTRVRTCIICASWLATRQGVGALLLSTPAVPNPSSAAVAAICSGCWRADLPLAAIDHAVEQTLRSVIPNGKLEPLIAPRCAPRP